MLGLPEEKLRRVPVSNSVKGREVSGSYPNTRALEYCVRWQVFGCREIRGIFFLRLHISIKMK